MKQWKIYDITDWQAEKQPWNVENYVVNVALFAFAKIKTNLS